MFDFHVIYNMIDYRSCSRSIVVVVLNSFVEFHHEHANF
jgi:hypothetical protein